MENKAPAVVVAEDEGVPTLPEPSSGPEGIEQPNSQEASTPPQGEAISGPSSEVQAQMSEDEIIQASKGEPGLTEPDRFLETSIERSGNIEAAVEPTLSDLEQQASSDSVEAVCSDGHAAEEHKASVISGEPIISENQTDATDPTQELDIEAVKNLAVGEQVEEFIDTPAELAEPKTDIVIPSDESTAETLAHPTDSIDQEVQDEDVSTPENGLQEPEKLEVQDQELEEQLSLEHDTPEVGADLAITTTDLQQVGLSISFLLFAPLFLDLVLNLTSTSIDSWRLSCFLLPEIHRHRSRVKGFRNDWHS